MSLKTIPGFGKSGMSRIFEARSGSTASGAYARCERSARQKSACDSSCASAARVSRSSTPESRGDDLSEQCRLAVGVGTELLQVPRCDAEARQVPASDHDLHVPFRIPVLSILDPRFEEPVILELAHKPCIGARPLAERAQVELGLGRAQTGVRPAAPLPLHRSGGVELLADDAERQELVPLESQDRLEAFHVLLGVEAVSPLRPTGGQEPLVLEVADLRNRDVRELRAQSPPDGADRERPARRFLRIRGRRHQCSRKVSRYLPIWTSSPSSSLAFSTLRRFTYVPFRLPESSIV